MGTVKVDKDRRQGSDKWDLEEWGDGDWRHKTGIGRGGRIPIGYAFLSSLFLGALATLPRKPPSTKSQDFFDFFSQKEGWVFFDQKITHSVMLAYIWGYFLE